MAHLRNRHLIGQLEKSASFWPVVGVLGLRQSGKSTLLSSLLAVPNQVTLDDQDAVEDARISAKNFLAKLPTPLAIDEAQKVPELFDAIKLAVDRRRAPGKYFLTGSSQFSARLGIRESLTGRIGLHYLYPLTLAEAHQAEFSVERATPLHREKTRFQQARALEQLSCGGLPTPLFTRGAEERKLFFTGWLETTVERDAARAFGGRYDPDTGWSILRQMARVLADGEAPTLKHFKQTSRTLRRYLQAFEDIFLLQKLLPHDASVAQEIWLPTDTGIASHLMDGTLGEGRSLSLGRVFVLKEIRAAAEYGGKRLRPVFYKSARSSPVDLIWDDIPIKVSVSPLSQVAYEERALSAAMKKLRAKSAILAWAHDGVELEGRGISHVPWTHWS
ncbi:MAG: ATP-binding protein [Steroidobacteraceae bacterium]